ncbi:hypothetical protein Gpo141_00007001 [Globisporangium polare]
MEEFFQFVGRSSASASKALLAREKLFLYASPRENPIDRCGEVQVGAYFACSSITFYEDQCWMKIRRGVFSNAKLNGYIRVEFDFSGANATNSDDGELPPHQQMNVASARPVQFKYMRRLPNFPSFLCARERLLVSRIPVFNLRESRKSFSSDDGESNPKATNKKQQLHTQQQRFLPAVSVFHATECQFNQDFTQMALKVTSTFGMTGWVTASFHETLIVVEDPRQQDRWRHPVLMQNVATKAGKLMGELPVRAIPSLQAPRLSDNNVEAYRIVEAVERKLVKDQVWIKIRNFASQSAEPAAIENGGGDNHEAERVDSEIADHNNNDEDTAKPNDSETSRPVLTEAWIIERNVNTGERVTIPWGSDCIRDEPNSDHEERFYRSVYARRPLPLRKSPELSAEIVGQVDPGAVFSSSMRVLNAQGRMWIRVPLSSSDENPQDAKNFGYAIQSNAKTNRCMLQEIAAPGKMAPVQYFQVVAASSSPEARDSGANMVTARAEPSATAKELFSVKCGAIVTVLGSQYVREERRMWLQVLAADVDSAMRVKQENVVLSDEEQHQNVVYLPVCDPSSPVDVVLWPIHRQLVKIANPSVAHSSEEKKSSARVVFSGRASKLFGSQLMQPSTIDLPTLSKKKEALASMGPVAAAAGETQSQSNDPAQALKDEINSWQVESEHLSAISSYVYSGVGRLTECLGRPFSSCLAKKEAMQKYAQLYQQDEEDDLEYGGSRLASPDVRV